jgi:methyl-accepting chemotaxis protein
MSGAPGAGLIIIAALTVIFLVIMLGEWNISRVILKPIKQLSSYSEKIAKGDLDFKVETDRSNEMGRLALSFAEVQSSITKLLSEVTSFQHGIDSGNLTWRAEDGCFQGDFREIANGLNNIMDMISGLVRNVKDSADLVSADSSDISGSAQALAQGASEQASSIEEISETVDNMSKFMKKTSENALTAKDLSSDVLREAKTGNSNMDLLLTKLNEINISSSSISKIIKNIEDIAFQTNILALGR